MRLYDEFNTLGIIGVLGALICLVLDALNGVVGFALFGAACSGVVILHALFSENTHDHRS